MSDEQLVNFLGRNKPKIIILTPEEFSQIDPEYIVEITEAESEKFLSQLFSSGYISVNQIDDGEYIIRAKIRLLGGGKIWKIVYSIGTAALIVASVVITAPVGGAFAGAAVSLTILGAADPVGVGLEDSAANPPAPVAAPDEENPAPQATPAASPRIHEDGW